MPQAYFRCFKTIPIFAKTISIIVATISIIVATISSIVKTILNIVFAPLISNIFWGSKIVISCNDMLG